MSRMVEVHIAMRFRVDSAEEAQRIYQKVGADAEALRVASGAQTFSVRSKPPCHDALDRGPPQVV